MRHAYFDLKQINYRGLDFPVKCYSCDLLFGSYLPGPTKPGEALKIEHKLFIDQWVIDIKQLDSNQDEFPLSLISFLFGPPKIIVKTSEWQQEDDFCDFDLHGIVKPQCINIETDKNSIYPRANYVGFYDPFFNLDRKHAFKLLKFVNIECTTPWDNRSFSFFYLPIPIQCTVRDQTPEERLLLSHYEAMPEDEKAREQERAEKERIERFELITQAAVDVALRPHEEILKKAGIIATPPDKRKPAENRQVLFDRQPASLAKKGKWIEVAKQCVEDAKKQVNSSMFDRTSMLLEPTRLNALINKLNSKSDSEKIIHDLADTLARQARRSSST